MIETNTSKINLDYIEKNLHNNISEKNKLLALTDLHKILSPLTNSIFLSGGTLLGYVREKNFIKWDDDIDLELFRNDFLQIIDKFKEVLDKNNFYYIFSNEKNFEKINCYKYNQKISLGTLNVNSINDKYIIRKFNKLPKKYFVNPIRISFKKLSFLIPNPPENFLDFVYVDWQKPNHSNDDDIIYNANYFKKGYYQKIRIKLIRFLKLFLSNFFKKKLRYSEKKIKKNH